MTEEEWLGDGHPASAALNFLNHKLNERKLRLFACASCNVLQMTEVGQRAVQVAEMYADGIADFGDLSTAHHLATAAGDLFGAGVATPPGDEYQNAVSKLTDDIYYHLHVRVTSVPGITEDVFYEAATEVRRVEWERQFTLFLEIFGNPFQPVTFSPSWRTSTALALAQRMYESRDFGAMPILADALQDTGCNNTDILDHCRGPGPHVRGCWVVDLVLGKQ